MINSWLASMFGCKAARRGGVVRRCIYDVVKFAGLDSLIAEVRRRGWRLLSVGDQVVMICTRDPKIEVVC